MKVGVILSTSACRRRLVFDPRTRLGVVLSYKILRVHAISPASSVPADLSCTPFGMRCADTTSVDPTIDKFSLACGGAWSDISVAAAIYYPNVSVMAHSVMGLGDVKLEICDGEVNG